MFESRRPDDEAVRSVVPQAEHVVDWLAARDEIEHTLRASLGGLPSEREERLARMADVLQATAQGLGPQAAAVWAGVPEHLLQQWLTSDQKFADAVRAASTLAAANAHGPGEPKTPAQIRVVVLALCKGATFEEAAQTAGLRTHQLRRLWRASPILVALVETARRARARKPKTYIPSTYRSRRPGRATPANGYRLVQRDDP
ncbi:hypothetical protein SALBM311S_03805 [Streptomyces alboniger]